MRVLPINLMVSLMVSRRSRESDTIMGLTAVAIKAAKGRAKDYKLADSDGLYLLVKPNGGRYWRMNYRFRGYQKTLSFGAWPEITLIDARARRDEARRQVARGTDPGEKLKLDRIAADIAAAITFRSVAEEWLTKTEKEGFSAVTLKKNRWLLAFAFEKLGHRPIAEITPHELLGVLRKIEGRGRHESAKRIRAICSQVFRYGIATARADRDVAADLRGALIVPKVTHRPAVTTPNEVGALLRAIESFEGHPTTDIALKLSPHVFVRRLEAMRRAGSGVERAADGSWTIAPDHLERVAAYEAKSSKDRPVIVKTLSSLPLDQQRKFNGPTWLDQELVSDAPTPVYNAGFGKDVKAALTQRRQWLMAQGLGEKGELGLWKPAHNMLGALRRRELLRVAGQLSGELGLNFVESRNGDRIEGIVKRHVDLAQGRFALIEKSREFTLVPWRDVLEKQIGKQVGGVMRESGVSWTIGRGRGGPAIS